MDFLSSQARVERLPSPGILPRDEDLVELLKSPDFDTRLQTLNRAMSLSKRDVGWFTRFQRKGDLFKSLDRILTDDRWEVQHQCIKFLTESMPVFENSLEYCMCYVMPNIITKLGSSKITVRRASIQLIQFYLKLQPVALGSLMKMISNFLLQSKENKILKSEVIAELPSLFIPEVSRSNWYLLLNTLLSYTPQMDKDMERIACVLQKLRVFVGRDGFSQIFQALPEMERKKFHGMESLMQNEKIEERAGSSSSLGRISAKYSQERRFRFGIVPMFISAMITDEDATQRISGLEKLKQIIEKIGQDELQRFVPHLHSYLMTLGHVLSDLNFKVVVLSLDVLRLTVNRLKNNIEVHLQQVISSLSKHFGNQKAVIKQLIMMTCMDLFQNLPPKSVVGALSVFLENRNSRIREEVVNIITSALMIISATKINFTAVINILVPMLLDPKRRVRLAAFEQISVVAYLMNGKLDPLFRAIRDAEEKSASTGLYQAVQARIRRHLLPRIRYDGLIEYSTPPVSDNSFDVDEAQLGLEDNMDLHFILHGSGDNQERTSSPFSSITLKHSDILTKRNKILPWDKDDEVLPASYSQIDMGNKKYSEVRMNPNASTNSWHAPPRRKVSLTLEDRSASAAIERNNSIQGAANTSEKRGFDSQQKSKDILGKSKSASNVMDGVENQPPKNFDEMPIRSAVNIDYGTSLFDDSIQRSTSQHSLNIGSSHASVKSTLSAPATKKQHNYLKSGTGNRARTVMKQTSTATKMPNDSQKKSINSPPAALELMANEDWNQKVNGLQIVCNLLSANPASLEPYIKEVVRAVIIECKNLRSSVSRVALTSLGNLYEALKTKMDSELEKACQILMNKTGDVSNAFIRDDASAALEKVAKYASPYKAMVAILAAGSSSKNNTVRASCALFAQKLVHRVGANQLLNNIDHLSHIAPHLLCFAKDRTPQVRVHGKQALIDLSNYVHFEKCIKKLPEHQYKGIKEVLDSTQKKAAVENDVSLSTSHKSTGIKKSGSTNKKQKEICIQRQQ